MKLPFTVDGRDVIVHFADADVTVAEIAAPAADTGTPPALALSVDGRAVGVDQRVADAALRPGDHLERSATVRSTAPDGSWAVHVIAGVDAGRVIPIPAASGDPVTMRVGRGTDMDVRLASNAVSKHHCTIEIAADGISVRDERSRNGTVVDGERIGDEGTVVEVNEPIRCGPAVVCVRAVPHRDTPQSLVTSLASAPSGPVPFYRSPVDYAPAPVDDVPLPPAPRLPKTGRPSVLMIVLPVVIAVVLVRLTGQWFYAIFALMTPAMMLFTTIERAGRNRRIRKRSKRRYRAEVAEFGDDLLRAIDHEQRRRRTIHSDPAELVRRATVGSAALWSRRPDHPEFLRLSLGLADMPWDPPVEAVPDELGDLEEMVTRAATLRLSPLAIDATPGTLIGLAGERAGALAGARGLLLQAVVEHGPAEVRVILVTALEHAADWDWLKWLPHLRPTFAESNLLTVVSDPGGHIDGSVVDAVLADAESGATLLVVVDTAALADSGDTAIRRLLRRPGSTASGIVIAPTVDGLPDQCEVVVQHHESLGEATCRWPRLGGRTLDFVVGGISSGTASVAARGLARLVDPDSGGGSAALPARVGVAEILGLTGAGATDITARWSNDAPVAPIVGWGEDGPLAVDLRADGPHLVVVGGRGSGKTEHLTSIVLSLAARLPPTRMNLVLWGESFSALHRLPHVASHLNRIDDSTVDQLVKGLDRELTRRERLRSADGGAEALAAKPALVVVIDDVDTVMRLVPIASDELVRLWRRARGLNVHIIWSASRGAGGTIDDLFDLSPVRVVLRVATVHESTELVGSESAAHLERSLPGRGYLVAGRADTREIQGGLASIGAPRPERRVEVRSFSLADGRTTSFSGDTAPPDERLLVSIIAAAGAHSPRPVDLFSQADAAISEIESPGLLAMLGIDGVRGLAEVSQHWHTSDVPTLLQVPIGVDPDMRPVVLDVRESALSGMGPHGLLVGATGSGKSELLRTLVGGLAVTHSPEMLAFVLIDFKGGASFANLGRIPHAAGLVTNLADDMAAIDRILAALDGEQKRRQELLARAGNLANVREYRAARRAGRLPAELTDVPLPELMVVVDEFAELLDQQPEFIDWFLTIGRVGRSLGIHLLLASQRLEEGKLRGLDTYLSYRLGLRTFSAAESRIVLGVADAYSLPQAPGGGYLKVGSTSFQRFQASYVSGPVDDAGAGDDADSDDAVASVLDAVVTALEDAAEPVHQIWLPPLGAAVTLDSLFAPDGFVHDPDRGFAAAHWPGTGRLAVPVGLVDEPERQRQSPLVVDFAGSHGHLALCGAPQTGKSMFVRTTVMSLAVTHTPLEVQVYAVDYGGGTLDALAGLAHVGAVASRLEPERVERVVLHVARLLADREERFRAAGIDSVSTMRSRRNDGELDAGTAADVFLVIDGWAAFREQFEGLEPVIADLVGRGLGYGIHVVITANRWMELRANVLDSIGGRLELRSNNPVDSLIDRRRAAVIRPDQPGRGLHPSRHLFQVALPRLDAQASAQQLHEATNVAVENITSRWEGPVAPPVRLLPTRLTVEELLAGDPVGGEAPVDLPIDAVPVGLAEVDMQPWTLQLGGSEPHFFVYGDSECGKTTFLHTFMRGLADRFPPERAQVLLVDYRRTSLEVVPQSHLRGYAAADPAAYDLIADLAATVTARLPGADVTARQLRQRSWWDGPELYVVVDDYDLVVTPSGNPLAPLLALIAQGRDVGLHLVIARRVAGAGQAMYEPVTARTREVSPHGLIMSGDRDEGALIGSVRAAPQPPGRGILVQRRRPPGLVQVAIDATP